MPSIQDLPDELLKHTLSFLLPCEGPQWKVWNEVRREEEKPYTSSKTDDEDDDEGNVRALYELCLVSKRFREIAQPLLLLDFFDDGTLGCIEETVRFANCLYRYPELGQFVQDFRISDPMLFTTAEDPGIPLELSDEDIELYTTVIKAFNLGAEQAKWISAMKKGEFPVFVALVLNKTPNLRRLAMPGGTSLPNASVNPFPALFRHNPSCLNRLESLNLSTNSEGDGYDLASYQDFLALPNLKVVMLDDADLQSATCPSTWEPGTLNIQDFIFHGCVIDAASLKKLLRACKNVKAFFLDDFGDCSYGIDGHRGSLFNAADAYQSLLGHKETLEYLRIEFPRSEIDLLDWQRFLSSRPKMGPLREFSALQSIRLQQAVVSVHPQLSPALKRLMIVDCNSSVINLVRNIAKDTRKGLYPNFADFQMLAVDITKPVKLPGQVIPEGQTPAQAHQSLVDMFKDTKVDFLIAPMPSTDDFMGELDDLDDLDDDNFDDDDFDDDDFDDDDMAYDAEGREIEDPIRDALRRARLNDDDRNTGPNGPMPAGLLDYFMRRAMQDPDFAHLRPPQRGPGRAPWDPPEDE